MFMNGIMKKREKFFMSAKDMEIDAYCMVTEIWDTGVVIGNKNITIGETTVFNDITSWDELLEDCTFLDGSPCGKLAEEDK